MFKLLIASALLVVAFAAETQVCYDCQAVARFLSAESKKPEQLIRTTEFLNSICDTFPAAEDKTSCANIATNLPKIILTAAPLLNDPTLMCIEAGLCGRDEPVHEDVATGVKIVADFVTNEKLNLECGLCEFAMTFLNGMFNNLKYQQNILTMLSGKKGLCSHLGKIEQTCDDLVNTYVPKLFMVLSKTLGNVKGTCTMLKMCGKTGKQLFDTREVVSMIAMEVAKLDTVPSVDPTTQFVQLVTAEARNAGALGKIACTVCKISFTGLLGYFEKDNTAIDGLANGIADMACNKVLPEAYNPDCLDFCGLYMAPVLQMTLEQLSPDKICEMILMCKRGE